MTKSRSTEDIMQKCVVQGDQKCMKDAIKWMGLNSILYMKRYEQQQKTKSICLQITTKD